MFIFLGHIPQDVTHLEIIRYISPTLKKSKLLPLAEKGMIEEIRLITLQDTTDETLEHHAILIVTPDTIAEHSIAALQEKPLKGKKIEVRKYYARSKLNDPRLKSLTKKMILKERRNVNSRRRKSLVVIKNSGLRPKVKL